MLLKIVSVVSMDRVARCPKEITSISTATVWGHPQPWGRAHRTQTHRHRRTDRQTDTHTHILLPRCEQREQLCMDGQPGLRGGRLRLGLGWVPRAGTKRGPEWRGVRGSWSENEREGDESKVLPGGGGPWAAAGNAGVGRGGRGGEMQGLGGVAGAL